MDEKQTPASRQGDASTSAPQPKSGTGAPSGKARKFVPNVPQRRKKVEDGGGNSADAASGGDAFKDLIRAAQTEGKWERAGRGRGRGRGQGPTQVTFAGSGRGFTTSVRNPSTGGGGGSARASGIKIEHGASGSRGVAGSSLSRAGKPGREAHLEAEHAFEQRELDEKPRKGTLRTEMLDYSQYYPTSLPLRDPAGMHPDEDDDEEAGLPVDLLTFQEDEDVDVASALGLLQAEEEQASQILFQLPSVLPAPVQQIKAEPLDRRRRGGGTDEAAVPRAASSLKELKAGKMGKLLVFESGAVKLQLGEVVLEVSLGSECECRQDVAALNATAGHCVFLGDIAHRAVCSPNIDQLLSGEPAPKWARADSAAGPITGVPGIPVVKSEAVETVDAMDINGSAD